MKQERIVVFLDLLGFKSIISEDHVAALSLLENFNTILHTKISDSSTLNKKKYSSPIFTKLIEQVDIDSFIYFIPMSDSIFIVADDADKLVKQLSTFLLESFLFTSHFYSTAKEGTDPTQVSITSGSASSDQVTDEVISWPQPYLEVVFLMLKQKS
jgi:hypothetical protein